METLYDVQQLFKQFGLYIYVGKRIYDIELMAIELQKLFEARLIDRETYFTARGILNREHRIEESREDF
ncbi:YqgQ family protein [Enterococcus saccharolyticus]|uniref:DUF910 family protein n=1 Tax=Enterococcus saccharolyticus subsp. saccharolyticus ATCC 43076 TaxID=1139996 RepID=S0J8B9_9ENTE|nr:YqgQ family protein [Enterococcus saccharolyticus]EOT28522.1 hypothetical protein OMQ_01671 [Enterococcus saccharolyticus subsp. saccharolyticus ATCC 43076]EOT81513.1 hypothetical protein I572_02048 [Enterococcus saccharolyticus subsp. saccharolyticus ATCC 43076]OJG87204.1 hypothetical protein RV16_GL000797 [Enterococcus saccharolyticus]